MKKQIGIGILTLIVLGGLLYYFLNNRGPEETAAFENDTVIEGNYIVPAGEQTTLKNGAKLTVKGNLQVDGVLACDKGSLQIFVEGEAIITNRVSCERPQDGEASMLAKSNIVTEYNISIIAKKGLTIKNTAEILANGNVQFVSDENILLKSQNDIDRVYKEIGEDTGDGFRIGPFTEDGAVAVNRETKKQDKLEIISIIKDTFAIPTASAEGAAPVVIAGKFSVPNPPPGVKRLVVFNFPDASEVIIENFELTGPKGRKGADDKGQSCTANGKDGEDAFRFTAVAPNLKVNNFTFNLGDGGDGGDAETTKDCHPGRATGGKGGKSGNFKMIGGSSFSITGAFNINPGRGGAGGGALAHGKDGGPSEDGGDAIVTGGRGSDNKKVLKVSGSIDGLENVLVGDGVAGAGGSALAEPGNGGSGDGCGKKGGKGGNGTATGGDGGDAKITLGGNAKRAPLAKDIGGVGGTADSIGASGGAGGGCDSKGPGGNGGNGGNASSKEGKGGMGSSGRQSDGSVLDETGGNGGNGGDGCKEGKGGKGGSGDPEGEDGKDGKNLCGVTPSPTTGTTPPTSSKTVRVIEYNGKFLPVDQLIVENEEGCGADHWHAARGVVKATDGSMVPDPGPQCGYGKVKDKPAKNIPDA